MQGSLCYRGGVLYVGRHEKTAHLRSFDLDGRALEARFSFRDAALARSAAAGLDVDDEHRVWVADTPAGCVRAFNLFGVEVDVLRSAEPRRARAAPAESELERDDFPGSLGAPSDVAVVSRASLGPGPQAEDLLLLVASGGRRRHALQLFELDDKRWVRSLRPLGDARGAFVDVRGVAAQGPWIYACEAGAGRIQVFREGEFHFAIRAPVGLSGIFEPTAAAALPDGRLVVCHAGPTSGALLLDPSGSLVRRLAVEGRGEGQVFQPNDLALDLGPDDRHSRVAVIDCDGERVQIFTLSGRCYGAFEGRVS